MGETGNDLRYKNGQSVRLLKDLRTGPKAGVIGRVTYLDRWTVTVDFNDKRSHLFSLDDPRIEPVLDQKE